MGEEMTPTSKAGLTTEERDYGKVRIVLVSNVFMGDEDQALAAVHMVVGAAADAARQHGLALVGGATEVHSAATCPGDLISIDRDAWRDLARRVVAAVTDAHEYGLDGRVGEMMIRLGDLLGSEDVARATAPEDAGGDDGTSDGGAERRGADS